MFFTHLGRIVAILALVVGIGLIFSGVGIATESIGPYETTLARHFPTKSSGALIDRGISVVLFGDIILRKSSPLSGSGKPLHHVRGVPIRWKYRIENVLYDAIVDHHRKPL